MQIINDSPMNVSCVLLRYSHVDLSSQDAYELAVKGLLRPQDKSPPILTGLRCLHFKPPQFTLGKSITDYIIINCVSGSVWVISTMILTFQKKN